MEVANVGYHLYDILNGYLISFINYAEVTISAALNRPNISVMVTRKNNRFGGLILPKRPYDQFRQISRVNELSQSFATAFDLDSR